MAAPKKWENGTNTFFSEKFFSNEIQPGLNDHWIVPYAVCVSCFD
jgi:hypothetical protein